jgi:hypothetical protein
MCFSPLASFATAGVTGLAGVIAMSRVTRASQLPLAAMPLFFGLQQAIEGALWLVLPTAPTGALASTLTVGYLLLAEVVWPLYAPAAAAMIEPGRARRGLMLACLALGAGVAAYFAWRLLTGPHLATLAGACIVYRTGETHQLAIGLTYLAATALPLAASSRRSIMALGAVAGVGSVVAYLFYWQAFLSVWCFFAAAASIVILGHFLAARRAAPRLLVAGA